MIMAIQRFAMTLIALAHFPPHAATRERRSREAGVASTLAYAASGCRSERMSIFAAVSGSREDDDEEEAASFSGVGVSMGSPQRRGSPNASSVWGRVGAAGAKG